VAAIAQVEPLTTARSLRGPFDYRLPAGLSGVQVGAMLVVPFGRREILGVVTGLSERSEVAEERLVEPLRALEPAIPPDLVALAQWMAVEYCSTPARALGLVLPPGAGRVAPRRVLHAQITEAGEAGRADPAARLTPGQQAVLELLSRLGTVAVTDTGAGHGTLRRLQARGLIGLHRRPVSTPRLRHDPVGARASHPPELNRSQREALATIVAAIEDRAAARLLLHGVTGSGKTEVYLRAAAATLQQGRAAIVLVPEIALTPQIVSRFLDRFGDTVAVLHSQLTPAQRRGEWERLRRGQARVCVGPRSAVFAPLSDLGLIVLDEEHDSSYKHEGDPRYDARLVAERRSHHSQAVLVAGSATPRPESAHRLTRLRLGERVDGRPLPRVQILDMREAQHPLHPRSAEALADLRRAGGKAILLLNRRGWSNFLTCRSCGHVWSCPACDVTLVLHRGAGLLACHHCGHREAVPDRCESCASVSVARHGVGTERLADELMRTLGAEDFPVLRLDADVAELRGQAARVLARFEAAPAGVLLGTQMVAKGHDFRDVSLGIVLDADSTLRFPDFRAEERTFALVAQLAGRVGRGVRRGAQSRVVVQTMAPDAPSIRLAADHDSDGFLARELERRRALSYPPFADLIRVVCASEQVGGAHAAARAVALGVNVPATTLLGPAPLFRLRGRERSQVVIKTRDRPAAVSAVGRAVSAAAAARAHQGVHFSVDVDPQ